MNTTTAEIWKNIYFQMTLDFKEGDKLNIQRVTDGLKAIGLFVLSNLIAILFLIGLGSIVYAVFLVSTIYGLVAAGIALILVALILSNEQRG